MVISLAKDWKFVKIMVTTPLIIEFFMNGERHFKVENGLDKDFEFVGIIQDQDRCMYHLFFKKGKTPEGVAAFPITPTITRLKK